MMSILQKTPLRNLRDALDRGVHKKILFVVGGGLGDQVCAEPVLSYLLENAGDTEVHLYADNCYLFEHHSLQLESVGLKNYDLNDFLVLRSYRTPGDMISEFFMPNGMNGVDYCSISALRMLMPHENREINLCPAPATTSMKRLKNSVIVHAGRSFPSKTLPADWWNELIAALRVNGALPILVGRDSELNGTVEGLDTTGTIDLRNQLTDEEFIHLLQDAHVVLTNDSAPLHIAASSNYRDSSLGRAWIGFVATAKHPDFLLHWRKGIFGWRMMNFARGGHWSNPIMPNALDSVDITKAPSNFDAWLHPAKFVAEWAAVRALSATW
jgi:hypothetical protein